LAASTAPWKVVYFHQPPYNVGNSHGGVNNTSHPMRWPFEQWGADLVMSGHEHDYQYYASVVESHLDPDPAVPKPVPTGIPYVVNGLGGNATLTADYGLVASDIPFGQASVSTSLVVGNPVRLEVTSPAAAARLFLADEANLQATKVYTVFMLGDAAAPVGTLVRDR
jgi:hypothetical protein